MKKTKYFSVWSFLKTLKTGLAYDLALLLLHGHPRNLKSTRHRDTHTFAFNEAPEIATSQNQPWCLSTEEYVKTLCHVHNRIHAVLKKGDYFVICRKIEETRDQWEQKVRLRRFMFSPVCKC